MKSTAFTRWLLKPLAKLAIRRLQREYKSTTELALRVHNSNHSLAKLKLIQSILYWFKTQFHAWGWFHPSCAWSDLDQEEFDKLFPEIEFKEVNIVVWHNPEAITYYQNKIFELSKHRPPLYEKEIISQLKKWKSHN